jgi:hypothetical protein
LKATFIARASAILITVPLLVLIQAPNGSADIEGNLRDESLVVTPCTDKDKTFPTSIYTKFETGQKGSLSGFEIRLSNKGGNCYTVLYSSGMARK